MRSGVLEVVSNCEFDSRIVDTSDDEAFCRETSVARIDGAPVAIFSTLVVDEFLSQMYVARTTDVVVEAEGITEVMIDGNVILLVLPFPEVRSGIPVDFILDGVRFRCEVTNQFRVQMAEVCTRV